MDALGLLDLVFAIATLVEGFGYLWLWRRHRFWLPVYAHFLAWGATLLAALLLWATRPAEGGVGKEMLFVLFLPLVVYFAVVFLGGAEAARLRRESGRTAEARRKRSSEEGRKKPREELG